MITKVTITQASVKDGQGDKGPWKKLGIQTNVHGDKWLSCFYPGTKYPNPQMDTALNAIKVGSTIDIVVETTPDGKYLNFKLPSRTDILEADVAAIKEKIGMTTPTQTLPSDDINPDDIPF